MNGIMQLDKEVEKAFQKMVKESAKDREGENLPYVNATSKVTEKFFKEMGANGKLEKKKDDDTLLVY